ncbi:MAG: D-alanine transaminase [Chloroflexota bacterium]|nr:D-alanine transaminase [Chloroflexota bacterium]
MAAQPREVYLNGRFVDVADATVSFEDRGLQFADSIYEVVRSYGGGFFEMQRHLERLLRGSTFLELGSDALEIGAVEQAADSLLRRSGLDDASLVLQVTRGTAPRSHIPAQGIKPTVIAYVRPAIWPPPELLETGIAVITVPDTRWERVDIKSSMLLPNVLAKIHAQQQDASDAIFVRDGVALECTASNLFAVIQGTVRTAPANARILPGVTRKVVMELCASEGIPLTDDAIMAAELASAQELFLTGTTDEITPITRLDGMPVSDGRPGVLTRRLMAAFRRRTSSLSPASHRA